MVSRKSFTVMLDSKLTEQNYKCKYSHHASTLDKKEKLMVTRISEKKFS